MTPNPSKQVILILLNDTDPILMRVLMNKFKKDSGWESIICTNYDEALSAFEKAKPDIVITEIVINDDKGRTGFNFIGDIKSFKHANKTMIVVFSDLGQEDDKEKARHLGVDHYFVKTEVTVNEFIDEIKKTLKH